MRMRHFMAVCLASLAVSNSVPQSLSACDHCRVGQACSSCQPSDDRGLLDKLDSFLMHRRPQLSPVTIPRLPTLDGSLVRAVTGRTARRWSAETGCGCELNEPTCGCELHQTGRYHTHGQAGSRAAISPYPAPLYEQLGESYSESYSEPYTPIPPAAVEDERYRTDGPHSLPDAPLPNYQPEEVVPHPDSEVDPFRDESAGRVRRIPARAVQHTQPQRDYRQSYDSQARREPVRMSLPDNAISGQSQMTAGSNYARRQNLDVNSSSRHRAVEPTRTSTERLPEVISAAGQRPLSDARVNADANHAYYSGNNSVRRTTQPQAAGVVNPLRSSSR